MGLRVGILTVSDRVDAGEMEDRGGPAVAAALAHPDIKVVARCVVPDDEQRITETLTNWADAGSVDVIFTTGGTGLGPRDVTPEATAAVCSRQIPGIAETMRLAGRDQTPAAMLSRAVAGIRGVTLIINLPGSPRGAGEGIEAVLPVLAHAIATLHGGKH